MAKKDVQLVVRAKNEASGALNSVAQSLDKVNKGLLENVKTGKTASGGMDALGTDVQDLAKRLEGLRGISSAAAGLNTVKNSIESMGKALANSASEFVTFSRQAREMQKALADQRAEAARLSAALDSQKAAVEAARQLTLKRADAARELTKAEAALKAVQAKPGADATAIAASTQRYTTAKGAVAALTTEHARLKSELEQTEAQFAELNAAIREQEKAYNRVDSARKRSIADARTQKTIIDETSQAYNKLSAEVQQTGTALGAITGDQNQLAAATQKAEAALREQQAVMAAMQRYSTGSAGGFADPKTAAALQAQRSEVEKVQVAWKALEADIRRQAEAMRGVVAPTQAQVTALQNTVNAARQAKAEHRQLAAAVEAAENAYRDAGSHVEAYRQQLKRTNDEMRRTPAAPPTSAWRSFYQSIYGDSRTAMSWTQRLRGEVLALGTAYLGLYGVINQAGGVIKAYQGLEAAQNRLGVVFKQNGELVRNELLWLERQAQRLGIEFGTLSDQYGKFSIAAQTANFSAQGTRDVFMAVAEAGRVAKLSTDQLQGTFLALEQMISKGRIQSEELRQQLGERLPGAVSILARSLGVTTAQLAKMMEQGQVAADEQTMLKFAKELNEVFGPQLQGSLRSTSAEIGRFFNNIYQAQLQVARGGFMEGMTKALREMDKFFQSREGRDFFLSLGAAAGRLMEVLAQIPQYFELIGRLIQTIVSLKLAQFFIGVATQVRTLGLTMTQADSHMRAYTASTRQATSALTTLRSVNLVSMFTGAVAAIRSVDIGLVAMSAKANIARGAITLLSTAMNTAARAGQLLFAAVGGWVGIAVTAITFIATELITRWVGGVSEATRNMDEHLRIVQTIASAYEELGKKTADWAKTVEGVSANQAEANYIEAFDTYNKSLDELTEKMKVIQTQNGPGLARVLSDAFSDEQLRNVRKFIDEFDPSNFDDAQLGKFHDALLELNAATDDMDAKRAIGELIAFSEAAKDNKGNLELAAAAVVLMGGKVEGINMSVEEATQVFKRFTDANKDTAESLEHGTTSASDYTDALKELGDILPGVTAEMKKLKDMSTLDTASLGLAAQALRESGSIGPALDQYGQGLANINARDMQPITQALGQASGVVEKSAALLRQFEGFIDYPKWDKNAYRMGYGSDTVTLSDGSVRKVVQGMTVTRADAERDLSRRIVEFQNVIRGQIGAQRFGSFTQDQQAALTSIAYNYGSLPDRITAAVKNGSSEEIRTAILSLKNDNDGINSGRRTKEAFLFSPSGVNTDEEIKLAQTAIEAENKITTAKREQLAMQDRSIAMARLEALGDERKVAVRQALNSAMDKGITDNAALWQVAEKAGEEFDIKNRARTDKLIADQQAQTTQKIAGLEQENHYQELINAGKERQAEIERQIAEAKKADPSLETDAARLAQLETLIAKNYDLANAEKARTTATEEAERRVNELMEYRSTLMENLRMQNEMGDTAGAQATQQALQGVNAELQAAITNAIQMWQAIGGPAADAAIAKLRNTQLQIQGTRQQMGAFGLSMQDWQGVAQNFASGMTGVFKKFAQAIGQGEDAMQALGEAFMEFAANFLIQIGEMIIQKALFNSIGMGMGGGGGGLLGGLLGFGHTGGVVGTSGFIGSANRSKSLSDILPSFHGGGIVGLGPTETLNVLEVGEEVITRNDPRHILNGGKGGGAAPAPASPNIKIINSFDAGEVVSEGMQTDVGEEAIINVVRKNPSVFRDIMNGA